MAVKAYQTKILLDQYDFSGQTNSVQIDCPVGVLEYQVLQNGHVQKLPSYPTPAIVHNGYYDGPAAGDMFDFFHDELGSANDITVGVILGTSLAIPVAYVLPTSFGQQLRIDVPVANLLTLSGNWPAGNDKLYRGYQAGLGEAVDSTGALTHIDFGAAGSAGGKAWLFVQDITGTATDAAIKVQSDSDSGFGTVADEGTFTFSAVGAYEVSLSGTVNRYVRANVTDLGGADDITFLMVVALSGITY